MSTIPILNLDFLVGIGVTSDLKFVGCPIAILATSIFSLFASSAVAWSYQPIWKIASGVVERIKRRPFFRGLSEESRALLAQVEEHGVDHSYYSPAAPQIVEPRNRDILNVMFISDSGVPWGRFSMARRYVSAQGRFQKNVQVSVPRREQSGGGDSSNNRVPSGMVLYVSRINRLVMFSETIAAA
jgi:hypothetical protein